LGPWPTRAQCALRTNSRPWPGRDSTPYYVLHTRRNKNRTEKKTLILYCSPRETSPARKNRAHDPLVHCASMHQAAFEAWSRKLLPAKETRPVRPFLRQCTHTPGHVHGLGREFSFPSGPHSLVHSSTTVNLIRWSSVNSAQTKPASGCRDNPSAHNSDPHSLLLSAA
jgi:hypothetical protein